MSCDTLNIRLSTILMDPPANGVAAIWDIWNVKGLGTVPAGLSGTAALAAGGSTWGRAFSPVGLKHY